MKVADTGSNERSERNMAGNVPLESEEQVAFFEVASYLLSTDQYSVLFAVPNGGKRHIRTAINLKREGVKAGVPDIIFAYPSQGYNGLFIELKRQKGGVVSEEQKYMLELLNANNYKAVVCNGCDDAVKTLKSYLGIEDG